MTFKQDVSLGIRGKSLLFQLFCLLKKKVTYLFGVYFGIDKEIPACFQICPEIAAAECFVKNERGGGVGGVGGVGGDSRPTLICLPG